MNWGRDALLREQPFSHECGLLTKWTGDAKPHGLSVDENWQIKFKRMGSHGLGVLGCDQAVNSSSLHISYMLVSHKGELKSIKNFLAS